MAKIFHSFYRSIKLNNNELLHKLIAKINVVSIFILNRMSNFFLFSSIFHRLRRYSFIYLYMLLCCVLWRISMLTIDWNIHYFFFPLIETGIIFFLFYFLKQFFLLFKRNSDLVSINIKTCHIWERNVFNLKSINVCSAFMRMPHPHIRFPMTFQKIEPLILNVRISDKERSSLIG